MDLSEYRRNLTNAYNVYGYVVLEKLLNSDTALHLRNYIEGHFSAESANLPYDIVNHANLGSIKLDVFNRFHEIYRRIFFHSPFVFHLKALLGDDFVIIPDTAIHKNSFGSWHKDSRAQQTAGLTFHWEEDFQIVTIGLYFQSNTREYGGGLEVIPGAHTIKFPQYPADAKGELVPSVAGDVVIFNHNLDHKASWPSREVTKEKTKYSVFLSASRNNDHVNKYMNFLKVRSDYGWIRNYSYPDDLVQHARDEGYGLAI